MAERLATSKVPRGVVHFRADAEAWLRAAGYFGAGPPAQTGGRSVFHATASRENATVARGPRGQAVFEKRNRAITLSDLQKVFRRARRFAWPLLHEWSMLWHARERGIRVPEPVAAGARRGLLFPRSDFLVTETLPGRSLFDFLEIVVAKPVAEQHRVARAVGVAVARLHAAGIAFPDLFAKHVYLEPDGKDGWEVGFLDLTSAYLRPRLSRAERARDLGALAASLPFRLPAAVVARCLSAYLAGGDRWLFRDAWKRAQGRAREFLLLRRFRSGITPRPASKLDARGSHHEMMKRTLLQRFEVPAVEDPGFPPTIRDDLADPLKRLLLATFRAGILPMGDMLPHLRLKGGGELAWNVHAPMEAPRKARVIHARWRIAFLRREIGRCALSPDVKKSLIRWLGGEPVAAFGLIDL